MVRSTVVFITVSLTGVHPGQPMLRSAARAGDQIAVTGFLGGSGGGLKLSLESGLDSDHLSHGVSPKAAEYLHQCQRRPVPAVAQGRALAGSGVAAAIDVSDGLADDLSKLCLASGLAARLYTEQVPVHPMLKLAFPDNFMELALNGGEDYVLLFAATPELMNRVISLLPSEAAVVGEMLAGETGQVHTVDASGAEHVAGPGGGPLRVTRELYHHPNMHAGTDSRAG